MNKHTLLKSLGTLALIIVLAVIHFGCASTPGKGGALFLKPGEAERIYLFGETPMLTATNTGDDPIPVEIQTGAASSARDTVAPGETRRWQAGGPWTFLFSNTSTRDVVIRYSVRGGEAIE